MVNVGVVRDRADNRHSNHFKFTVMLDVAVSSAMSLSLRWQWRSIPAGGISDRTIPVARVPVFRYQRQMGGWEVMFAASKSLLLAYVSKKRVIKRMMGCGSGCVLSPWQIFEQWLFLLFPAFAWSSKPFWHLHFMCYHSHISAVFSNLKRYLKYNHIGPD